MGIKSSQGGNPISQLDIKGVAKRRGEKRINLDLQNNVCIVFIRFVLPTKHDGPTLHN
jgi:hypothetical protein